jgi:hypothetical protein
MSIITQKICSIEGCEKKASCKGWCSGHYHRWQRYGDPTIKKYGIFIPCAVEGCDRRMVAKSYCYKHYERWKNNGDPLITKVEYHGMKSVPEYTVWTHMRARCYDKNSISYPNYGGRGITICDRWKSFKAFYEDMGSRPSPTHQLERINNDKGYSPENCKWATKLEQANNTRTNHLVTIDGSTKTIAEWSRKSGLGQGTIWYRVHRGWTGNKLLSPIRKHNK